MAKAGHYTTSAHHSPLSSALSTTDFEDDRAPGAPYTSALVTCDDDNIASAAIIELCGGKRADRMDVDGTLIRRYHVPTA